MLYTLRLLLVLTSIKKVCKHLSNLGSASSYGKKYALGNLFLIDDTQDSDATNNHGKGATATLTSTKDPAFAKAKDYVQNQAVNLMLLKRSIN